MRFGDVTYIPVVSPLLSKPSFTAPWRVGDECGRQTKCWMDNAKVWTPLPIPELLVMASGRKDWKRISAESFLLFLKQPNGSSD